MHFANSSILTMLELHLEERHDGTTGVMIDDGQRTKLEFKLTRYQTTREYT